MSLILWKSIDSLTSFAAFEKKYTEDHEWIELSDDRKTGTTT